MALWISDTAIFNSAFTDALARFDDANIEIVGISVIGILIFFVNYPILFIDMHHEIGRWGSLWRRILSAIDIAKIHVDILVNAAMSRCQNMVISQNRATATKYNIVIAGQKLNSCQKSKVFSNIERSANVFYKDQSTIPRRNSH